MEQNKPVRRRPPRTLAIPAKTEEGQGDDQKSDGVSARPARSRNRNSALIEKLQADLALSPVALGPGPMVSPLKSPGQRLQLPGFPSSRPRSPITPTAVANKQEVEAPTSFESPADGALLPSINKGRARLSVRRRPPSRRVKRSGDDEVGDEDGGGDSPDSPAGPAEGQAEETHASKTDTAETHGTETDAAKTHTDGPAAPDSETKTASEKVPEAEDKDKGELKTEAEACVATAEDKGAGGASATEGKEADKGTTESEKQDSSSQTKAAEPEADQASGAKAQGAKEDGGSQDVKDKAEKPED